MLANVQQKTIQPIIEAAVAKGTRIHTDEYDIYARLPAWGYQHKTVCHARGEYARDEDGDGFCEIHVNTIEGTWSLLRSWLRPHRGISQEKLPLYLGFFEFVHNARTPRQSSPWRPRRGSGPVTCPPSPQNPIRARIEIMIETVIEQRRRSLGGGLDVERVLPFARRRMVGPFIFFDHMGPLDIAAGVDRSLDVRPHPHIGLSTMTYLFAGEVMHRDSVGSEQAIRPGR